jgi:hypothetical protein
MRRFRRSPTKPSIWEVAHIKEYSGTVYAGNGQGCTQFLVPERWATGGTKGSGHRFACTATPPAFVKHGTSRMTPSEVVYSDVATGYSARVSIRSGKNMLIFRTSF